MARITTALQARNKPDTPGGGAKVPRAESAGPVGHKGPCATSSLHAVAEGAGEGARGEASRSGQAAPAATGAVQGQAPASATSSGQGQGGGQGGSASGAHGQSAGGDAGAEAARRKRNTVPARELHLLLTQASSAVAVPSSRVGR